MELSALAVQRAKPLDKAYKLGDGRDFEDSDAKGSSHVQQMR